MSGEGEGRGGGGRSTSFRLVMQLDGPCVLDWRGNKEGGGEGRGGEGRGGEGRGGEGRGGEGRGGEGRGGEGRGVEMREWRGGRGGTYAVYHQGQPHLESLQNSNLQPNERVITVGIGWVLLVSATGGFSGYIKLAYCSSAKGLQ